MTEHISIRPLAVADKPEYLELATGLADDYVAQFFENLVKDTECIQAVDQEGRMVGVSRLVPVDYKGRREYAYLGSARVAVDRRNEGIATQMAKHLICLARDRGYKWVGLCTNHYNKPVIAIMEKLGLHLYGHHLSLELPTAGLPAGPSPIRQLSLAGPDKAIRIAGEFSGHPIFAYRPYHHIPWGRDIPTTRFLDEVNLYEWNGRTVLHNGTHGYFIHVQVSDNGVLNDLESLAALLANWHEPDKAVILELPLGANEIGRLPVDEDGLITDINQWYVYGLALQAEPHREASPQNRGATC